MVINTMFPCSERCICPIGYDKGLHYNRPGFEILIKTWRLRKMVAMSRMTYCDAVSTKTFSILWCTFNWINIFWGPNQQWVTIALDVGDGLASSRQQSITRTMLAKMDDAYISRANIQPNDICNWTHLHSLYFKSYFQVATYDISQWLNQDHLVRVML